MTIKRSWLVLTCSSNNASTVADSIWKDNEGEPFGHQDLKKGWLVRADVLDASTIMVPAVGECKSNVNKDPIDVIVKKIEHDYDKYGVKVTDRYNVTEHYPSDGSGNDDPDPAPEPLNGWG